MLDAALLRRKVGVEAGLHLVLAMAEVGVDHLTG